MPAFNSLSALTEGIPIQDMMEVSAYLKKQKVRLVGPSCPGLLTPCEWLVGITPGNIALPGNIGLVSRHTFFEQSLYL